MPKYRYDGQEPCAVGGRPVNPGEVVDSSFSPGKRFMLIEEQLPTMTTAPPQEKATAKGGSK